MPGVVLNVSADESLLATRKAILEQIGFKVVSATNLLQVEAACKGNQVGAVVLGHSIPRVEKQRIITTVRDLCHKGTPVISCLYRNSPTEAADADEAVSAQDGPEALIKALQRRL